MKDIRPALVALLLADSTVNNLIGGERIYPVKLPQGKRDPSIVYHRITGLVDYQMNGSSALVETLMQFDTTATTANNATTLGNAVHDVLSGFQGIIIHGTASPPNSVNIHGIFQSNERDLYDAVTEMFLLQRDYIVWYWER